MTLPLSSSRSWMREVSSNFAYFLIYHFLKEKSESKLTDSNKGSHCQDKTAYFAYCCIWNFPKGPENLDTECPLQSLKSETPSSLSNASANKSNYAEVQVMWLELTVLWQWLTLDGGRRAQGQDNVRSHVAFCAVMVVHWHFCSSLTSSSFRCLAADRHSGWAQRPIGGQSKCRSKHAPFCRCLSF